MNTIQELMPTACPEAIEWGGDKTLAAAYKECERADWLLWAASQLGVDRKLVVRAACACARAALQYVPPNEERPLKAIEAAESWAQDGATIDEVRTAADAAAYAVASTAVNAAKAAVTASAHDRSEAHQLAHMQMCALIREIIPLDVVLEAIK